VSVTPDQLTHAASPTRHVYCRMTMRCEEAASQRVLAREVHAGWSKHESRCAALVESQVRACITPFKSRERLDGRATGAVGDRLTHA
jgi:hypothetical protein